jgi:hypothetical protein
MLVPTNQRIALTDFREQRTQQESRKVWLPSRMTVAKLRSMRGVLPQLVGSNEFLMIPIERWRWHASGSAKL